MRKMFRHDAKTLLLILGSTLLIPFAAFAAVACTDDSGPAAEGTVTIAVGEVPPLIQEPRRDIRATGGIGKDLSIYETIVRAPHVSPPTPPPQDHTAYSPADLGLAESWEVASDFNSITFKIRKDIPWHNNGGDWGDLTAEDVAWSFNSAFAPIPSTTALKRSVRR